MITDDMPVRVGRYSHFVLPDGSLNIIAWAGVFSNSEHGGDELLQIYRGLHERPMAHSLASGTPLVSNGRLGADLIRVRGGTGFEPHTHPGDHLLVVLAGEGTITYKGKVYPTNAGQIYMVEGAVPHAVGAITDHVIMSIGSPHMPVDSPDRMKPVEYRAVAADLGSLHCLICDRAAEFPILLHEVGCLHCPCALCASGNAPSDMSGRY